MLSASLMATSNQKPTIATQKNEKERNQNILPEKLTFTQRNTGRKEGRKIIFKKRASNKVVIINPKV